MHTVLSLSLRATLLVVGSGVSLFCLLPALNYTKLNRSAIVVGWSQTLQKQELLEDEEPPRIVISHLYKIFILHHLSLHLFYNS